MKTKNILILLSLVISGIIIAGCDSMDDNFKQYLEEYNYSGKIKNLAVLSGYQRVILTWENPKDQKSTKTLVVYGDQQLEFDHLVDSVSIQNLTSGSGYEFTVYTLDLSQNRSVPVSITALPVSQDFVERLVAPGCRLTKSGNTWGLLWSSLSNVSMQFSGTIQFQMTGSDGSTLSKTISVPAAGKTKTIKQHSLLLPEIKSGVVYTISYNVSVWPVLSKIVTEDIVPVEGSVIISVS